MLCNPSALEEIDAPSRCNIFIACFPPSSSHHNVHNLLPCLSQRQRKQFGLMMHCIEEQHGVETEEDESMSPTLPDTEAVLGQERLAGLESMEIE